MLVAKGLNKQMGWHQTRHTASTVLVVCYYDRLQAEPPRSHRPALLCSVLSAAAQSLLTNMWVMGHGANQPAFHVWKYIPDA